MTPPRFYTDGHNSHVWKMDSSPGGRRGSAAVVGGEEEAMMGQGQSLLVSPGSRNNQGPLISI